jgi:queuine tRNA-ribosyltransferase
MNSYFSFQIIFQSKKSQARVGRIYTPHGIIDTPGFVAVGTNATMKALDNQMLEDLNQQLMFCNTYHLMLHPGADVVEQAGGLHRFMNRQRPIITDSGGFQVFSLAYGSVASELKSKGQKQHKNSVLKITEEGVLFRSYRNGDLVHLTPESSVIAQKKLGADIIIPFDELPPYHIAGKDLKKSLDRTHRWEKRSLDQHLKNKNQQAMYAVIHGGIDPALRQHSCSVLTQLDFDGFAIGGSVGKNRQEMVAMLQATLPHLPENKPNHLLGIADLPSIADIIPLGIDTFDSSHPTKCARHGHLFTSAGVKKIEQAQWKNNFEPLDALCHCYTCKHYTNSFVHHLFKAKEAAAHTLATIHNIAYMNRLMANYREKILAGEL